MCRPMPFIIQNVAPITKLTHTEFWPLMPGRSLKAVDPDSPHRKQNVKAGLLCVAVLGEGSHCGQKGAKSQTQESLGWCQNDDLMRIQITAECLEETVD